MVSLELSLRCRMHKQPGGEYNTKIRTTMAVQKLYFCTIGPQSKEIEVTIKFQNFAFLSSNLRTLPRCFVLFRRAEYVNQPKT
jgi:hypothetical protein